MPGGGLPALPGAGRCPESDTDRGNSPGLGGPRKRALERQEKAEAEKLELESREQKMRLELEWYRTLDTLPPATWVLLVPDPQKAELLAGLAKIKAQSSLSTEQLLAMAVASSGSPLAAEVLKALVTRATALEDKELYERRVSEQKEARSELRAMSDSFLKAQQELFNKTLETLSQISQGRGAAPTPSTSAPAAASSGPQPVVCPRCLAQSPAGTKRCPNCGETLL